MTYGAIALAIGQILNYFVIIGIIFFAHVFFA